MTWAEAAKELGRRPVTIVELYVDYCSLVYGVGACPAVLGVDSVAKCYNTRKTCPVPLAFDPAFRCYRFSNRELGPLLPSVPCLTSVSFTSTKIDPGKSLGQRSSVQFQFQDFPWDDRDVDKYASTRVGDPESTGTYFGKWLARNPYYQNRVCKVLSGYMDDDGSVDLSKFQTRTFLLSKVDQPDAKGIVSISCMDPIRLIDDSKAQCPKISTGSLSTDITNVGVTLTLLPSGVGAEYPANGTAAIDEEVVNFSRVGDVITLNLRGAQTTTAQEHKLGATFQLCKVYVDVPVADVLYELMTVFGSVPLAYINKPAWDAECATWLGGHLLNCTIATPTGVNALVTELVATCLFYIWWDDVTPTIRMKAVRPEDPSLLSRVLTDNDSFLAGSISMVEDPDQRISELWAGYNRKNPLLKLDEWRNYRTVDVFKDADAESVHQYNERRVRRLACRFFSDDNIAQIAILGERMLARYRDNVRNFKFDLDAKDADIQVGDVVEVYTKSLQGPDGLPVTTNMIILKRTEKREGHTFSYEATDSPFYGRYGFILPTGTADYLSVTAAVRNKGCFICVTATELMPNGDPPYKIV